MTLILISIPVPISILISKSILKHVFRPKLVLVSALISEIYLEITPPSEVEYFSKENHLIDIKNYVVTNLYSRVINNFRPIKINLVCDYGIKYLN